jgi:integron integrase
MCPEPDRLLVPPSEPNLLDQLRSRLRVKHYSIRAEQAYVDWVRRFVLFHDKRHPRDLGSAEVEAFLTNLAVRRRVSASTQNQAKSAILFLYKEAIDKELPWLNGVVAARVSQRLPVVLSVEEVNAVLGRLRGTSALVARLLYGSGLRILECLRLRVKDMDFASREILVREGKGAKDRVTMLPENLVEPLQRHLERVRELHSEDLAAGYGSVYLPYALDRKYPNAGKEWMWQYVFPSPDCPKIRARKSSGAIMPTKSRFSARYSQRCAGPASINPQRPYLAHSFATHLLQNGYDIRTVQ